MTMKFRGKELDPIKKQVDALWLDYLKHKSLALRLLKKKKAIK
jgi:hypothetical protein